MLPGLQIRSKSKNSGAAVWAKLQHLDRVAKIEVKHLVRVQHVHFREGARLQQVIDRRALSPRPALQLHTVPVDVYVRRKKPPSTGCGSSRSSVLISSAVRLIRVASSRCSSSVIAM